MLLRISSRAKRAVLIAAAAVVTAGLAIVPWQARAQETTGLPFLSANLTITMRQESAGGGAIRYTVRVLNNGPDDLADGDYRVSLEWAAGTVLDQPGDSPCFELSANGCVIDGPAVEFIDGPITGPGFVDLRITAIIPDRIFFVSITEINFSQLVDPFPDFGLQPPIMCSGNNCSSF